MFNQEEVQNDKAPSGRTWPMYVKSKEIGYFLILANPKSLEDCRAENCIPGSLGVRMKTIAMNQVYGKNDPKKGEGIVAWEKGNPLMNHPDFSDVEAWNPWKFKDSLSDAEFKSLRELDNGQLFKVRDAWFLPVIFLGKRSMNGKKDAPDFRHPISYESETYLKQGYLKLSDTKSQKPRDEIMSELKRAFGKLGTEGPFVLRIARYIKGDKTVTEYRIIDGSGDGDEKELSETTGSTLKCFETLVAEEEGREPREEKELFTELQKEHEGGLFLAQLKSFVAQEDWMDEVWAHICAENNIRSSAGMASAEALDSEEAVTISDIGGDDTASVLGDDDDVPF